MAVEAQATARGVRTSAQKAGLVCELIRGKNVNQALATLQFTRKTIARELAIRMGGSLGLNARRGRTEFELRLPAAKTASGS